jgi:hypothetical protein
MSRMSGNLYVAGTLQAQTLVPSTGSVSNTHVADAAAIEHTKLRHRHVLTYGQSGTAAAATVPIHLAHAAGTILAVSAGVIGAHVGDSTTTVDVKRQGTSILTAPIVLDSGNAARTEEAGTLDGAQDDVTAGDLLEVVVTVNAGTGTLGTGLFVNVVVSEDGQ